MLPSARIYLNTEEFVQFVKEVLGSNFLGYFEGLLKVEPAIEQEDLDVEAVRIYLSEFMKEVDMTTERGEHPRIRIKKIRRKKTGKIEFEFVFLGSEKDRHVEDLSYFSRHPSKWTSYEGVYFTPKQAKALYDFLGRLLEETKQSVDQA